MDGNGFARAAFTSAAFGMGLIGVLSIGSTMGALIYTAMIAGVILTDPNIFSRITNGCVAIYASMATAGKLNERLYDRIFEPTVETIVEFLFR